jgi:hypothetical protein
MEIGLGRVEDRALRSRMLNILRPVNRGQR